jgi:hypothetical protein
VTYSSLHTFLVQIVFKQVDLTSHPTYERIMSTQTCSGSAAIKKAKSKSLLPSKRHGKSVTSAQNFSVWSLLKSKESWTPQTVWRIHISQQCCPAHKERRRRWQWWSMWKLENYSESDGLRRNGGQARVAVKRVFKTPGSWAGRVSNSKRNLQGQKDCSVLRSSWKQPHW